MNIYFKESHGRCLGTYPLKGQQLFEVIKTAYNVGYRFFDTAQMYENESDLGQSIKKLGIPRSKIFITTKVHPHNYTNNLFISSVEQSLKFLETDYIDVLLLHWPDKNGDNSLSLELLEKTHKMGLAHHIGISNYNIKMMKDAVSQLKIKPITNQVEFHPLVNQSKLLVEAKKLGITLSAYCSVVRGQILDFPELHNLAKKNNKTVGQVVLRWIFQKGVISNTMSTNPENIKNNFEIMDFTLDENDMLTIENLNINDIRIVSKEIMPTDLRGCVPKWD